MNPDHVRQASNGFNLMFEKLKIQQESSSTFYNLFGRVQDHFINENSEKDLQRLIIMAYLNDKTKFENLAALMNEV